MVSDIERLTDKLEQLPEDIEDAASDAVEDGLETTESRAKRNLRRDDTWFEGDIGRSISVVSTENGFSLIVGAQHGPYVEYGTGAYFGTSSYPVPSGVSSYDAPGGVSEDLLEGIEHWVENKPIEPNHYDTQSEVAEAIAHTIAELGTQAHPYLRPAWYGYREQLLNNVKNDVQRTVRRKF